MGREKHWEIDIDRVVERSLERMYGDLDELDLSTEGILEYLRFWWGFDIADGYEEWIRDGE